MSLTLLKLDDELTRAVGRAGQHRRAAVGELTWAAPPTDVAAAIRAVAGGGRRAPGRADPARPGDRRRRPRREPRPRLHGRGRPSWTQSTPDTSGRGAEAGRHHADLEGRRGGRAVVRHGFPARGRPRWATRRSWAPAEVVDGAGGRAGRRGGPGQGRGRRQDHGRRAGTRRWTGGEGRPTTRWRAVLAAAADAAADAARSRPCRWWPARAGRPTWASAAPATSTRARGPPRCCCARSPTGGRFMSLVGLVVVSHSARLADGVAEVAAQMAPDVTVVGRRRHGRRRASAPTSTR